MYILRRCVKTKQKKTVSLFSPPQNYIDLNISYYYFGVETTWNDIACSSSPRCFGGVWLSMMICVEGGRTEYNFPFRHKIWKWRFKKRHRTTSWYLSALGLKSLLLPRKTWKNTEHFIASVGVSVNGGIAVPILLTAAVVREERFIVVGYRIRVATMERGNRPNSWLWYAALFVWLSSSSSWNSTVSSSDHWSR